MWVSVLKKRGRFRIGMGFEPAQVSARDGLRHETGFGSERVQFKLSFGGTTQVWIRTGRFGSAFGPTWVSARDGFRIATGFGPARVSHETSFG
ncbi:hypothetical protein Hanom_Chr02g00174171 [Helianthus anomalus]